MSHLTHLTSLYLSANSFTGPFPSEPAPPSLSSCYVMPNDISPCPSDLELAHPESLAAKCHVRCPKSPEELASEQKAAGIPVSPLPGEAGQSAPNIGVAGAGSAVLTPPPLAVGA